MLSRLKDAPTIEGFDLDWFPDITVHHIILHYNNGAGAIRETNPYTSEIRGGRA